MSNSIVNYVFPCIPWVLTFLMCLMTFDKRAILVYSFSFFLQWSNDSCSIRFSILNYETLSLSLAYQMIQKLNFTNPSALKDLLMLCRLAREGDKESENQLNNETYLPVRHLINANVVKWYRFWGFTYVKLISRLSGSRDFHRNESSVKIVVEIFSEKFNSHWNARE